MAKGKKNIAPEKKNEKSAIIPGNPG